MVSTSFGPFECWLHGAPRPSDVLKDEFRFSLLSDGLVCLWQVMEAQPFFLWVCMMKKMDKKIQKQHGKVTSVDPNKFGFFWVGRSSKLKDGVPKQEAEDARLRVFNHFNDRYPSIESHQGKQHQLAKIRSRHKVIGSQHFFFDLLISAKCRTTLQLS